MIDDDSKVALRRRIEELEKQLRAKGRDVDDRFRAAVDPIGEKVESRFEMEEDSMKNPMRIFFIVLAIVIVIGVVWWAMR